MIPPTTTRHILETAKIEEVIHAFLPLRRNGANLIALCPFHREKTPSFSVSPARNIFKCFGCGKGGNSAKFLMEHEGFSFPEALRWLAKKYHIEIQETPPTPAQQAAQQEEESLFIVNGYAQKFFQDNLVGIGLEYLESRGFSEATIHKFRLGYAPDSWDAFTKTATASGFKPDQLKKLGLTTRSDRDFFRNRVIFPIHDLSGKVVAFAGRTLQQGANAPKYLNSPESDIYHKSKTLYSIQLARNAIRQQDECILVEGYTDLISLHQAGIENAVASAGTSLTVEQLLLIRRFSPNLKILYDGDPAGIKAALKGLDLALEQDMNVKIVTLPHPDDPDSYLRKVGIGAFRELINREAKDFISFKANLLLDDVENDPAKKAAVLHDIVGSIARVSDPIKRSFFIKHCAGSVGLGEEILEAETNKAVQALANKKQVITIVQQESATTFDKELRLVQLLLEYGTEIFEPKENTSVADYILGNTQDLLEYFEDPLCQRIMLECNQLAHSKQPITMHYFIAHEDPAISGLTAGLAASFIGQGSTSPTWQERGFQDDGRDGKWKDIAHTLLLLRLETFQRLGNKNRQQLEAAQIRGDMASAIELLKAQAMLDRARNELATSL